jgi:hypothetical protein
MCLSVFLFQSELGTWPQNLIPTRGVEHWEKNHFPQGGMLKFTYKGRLLTIKIAYVKLLDWKSERWKHALVHPLHLRIFIFEKYWNLDFWWNFKVSFLGSFGQILLHWQWLTACPNLAWNLKNLITFEP